MKGHIIISHGLESSPDATKATALSKVAEALGWTQQRPDYRDLDAIGRLGDVHGRIARLRAIAEGVQGPLVLAGSSMGAAEELKGDGWEIEVVDLRAVKPLDTDTIIASVARTGRLLCVGEAWPWGGVTAEVIARVSTEAFGMLDAPPQRLNAKDTPVPYHPNLWAAHRFAFCGDSDLRQIA